MCAQKYYDSDCNILQKYNSSYGFDIKRQCKD